MLYCQPCSALSTIARRLCNGGLHVKARPSIRTAHRALRLMPSTRAVQAVERLHSIRLVCHHDQPRTKDPLSLDRHAVREDTARGDVASHPTPSFRAWTGPRDVRGRTVWNPRMYPWRGSNGDNGPVCLRHIRRVGKSILQTLKHRAQEYMKSPYHVPWSGIFIRCRCNWPGKRGTAWRV
jgi:hypothetical protein